MIEDQQLQDFCDQINVNRDKVIKSLPGMEAKVVPENGKRYARLVLSGPVDRSAFGFVDLESGAVYKAAGWKGPAKGVRGYVANGPKAWWVWGVK